MSCPAKHCRKYLFSLNSTCLENSPTRISVVIPVYNGAHTLPRVLEALTRANPAPYEIIIVDDGSTDPSAALAEKAGCRVLKWNQNIGAAAAKNYGAAQAGGEILFFTDADIVVPPDIFRCLAQAFAKQSCDGVVGLLDPEIPTRDFPSQFKNLWMNFTYARFADFGPGAKTRPGSPPRAPQTIGLFYTSCAAIRRECFARLGGFDENYRGASIAEDTEFGQRAWAQRTCLRLVPDLRVNHLKTYSLKSVLREDFRRARALMLMRLRKWGQPFFTSVPFFYQLAVPVLYLALSGILILLGSQIANCRVRILNSDLGPGILDLVLSLLLLFYLLNAPLLAFLARMRGLGFAARAAFLLPLDVFVVGLGMLAACFDFARGRRY